MEISKEEDWNSLLKQEEEYVENLCAQIASFKPDVVITEKGVSDLAQHYLVKANISAIRRIRKSDNNRIARAAGATIVSRTDEIQESDIGTGCGLFEVRKIGDEYYSFLEECHGAKACSIILRGGSKDVLNEVERNLQDAMQVVRNVILEPRVLPGGGATEIAVSIHLNTKSKLIGGSEQFPYLQVSKSLEIIPKILSENCGLSTIKVLTQLKSKHYEDLEHNFNYGIDGNTGEIINMENGGIWEPFLVKIQTLKTSIESACLILRIDDIVSGVKKKK